MEGNKKILLQILMLLNILPLLCSCVDKVEYTYENVVITRYDHWDHWPSYKSVYYCNTSDKKCKIEVSGAQNYYTALLCIDKETKKVWIIIDDCYIRQQEVDSSHFYGDMIGPGHVVPKEIKDIHDLKWAHKLDLLKEKYECYALKGMGDYLKYEKEDSKKIFPNSKIEAQYYYNIYERGVRW